MKTIVKIIYLEGEVTGKREWVDLPSETAIHLGATPLEQEREQVLNEVYDRLRSETNEYDGRVMGPIAKVLHDLRPVPSGDWQERHAPTGEISESMRGKRKVGSYWAEEADGERWQLRIYPDSKPDGRRVIDLDVRYDDKSGTASFAPVWLSPQQAREIAEALWARAEEAE